MADHAVLDPVPGGQFTLDVNGVPVRGRYLAVERPHRLLISWGHAGSDRLLPGASTLEVIFTPRDGGTTVTVVHAGLPAPEASQHRLGWAHSWIGGHRCWRQRSRPRPWAAVSPAPPTR
jgi:uncharacterized protein YndB with AHSA1/START domain